MTYSNTPNTGDTLGSTRVPINTNFSLIQAGISQDHNALGTGAGVAGKHTVIHLAEQATEGQTTATESALYTKSGGNGDIFARSPNHVDVLPNGEYQLTSFSDANIASFGESILVGLNTSGWTFLPGGLLLQYGNEAFLAAVTHTITFPVPFKVGTKPYSITLGNSSSGGQVIGGAFTTNVSFDLQNTVSNLAANIYWMAIGKA